MASTLALGSMEVPSSVDERDTTSSAEENKGEQSGVSNPSNSLTLILALIIAV